MPGKCWQLQNCQYNGIETIQRKCWKILPADNKSPGVMQEKFKKQENFKKEFRFRRNKSRAVTVPVRYDISAGSQGADDFRRALIRNNNNSSKQFDKNNI